jgi:hypothetical protein
MIKLIKKQEINQFNDILKILVSINRINIRVQREIRNRNLFNTMSKIFKGIEFFSFGKNLDRRTETIRMVIQINSWMINVLNNLIHIYLRKKSDWHFNHYWFFFLSRHVKVVLCMCLRQRSRVGIRREKRREEQPKAIEISIKSFLMNEYQWNYSEYRPSIIWEFN